MKKNKILLILLLIFLIGLIIIGGVRIIKNNNSNEKDVKKIYDAWSSKYISDSSQGSFVNTGKEKRMTVSEAQGYGMLIEIEASKKGWSKQENFDKLTEYYKAHTISESNNLMAWKQTEDGNSTSMVTSDENNTSATDGDLDIAYALFEADNLWGSEGNYNYKEIANSILNDLLKYNYQSSNNLLLVGDWARSTTDKNNLVRTSDLIVPYYQYFYKKTGVDTWKLIADKSIKVLNDLSSKTDTGLMPDFIQVYGDNVQIANGKVLESEHDGDYYWNANRVPLRLAGSGEELAQTKKKLLTFFSKQKTISAGYGLNGQALVDYSSTAFTSPVAVLANQEDPKSNLALKSKNETLKNALGSSYYADTLQVLSAFTILNMEEKN